jgi:hypothetical protein
MRYLVTVRAFRSTSLRTSTCPRRSRVAVQAQSTQNRAEALSLALERFREHAWLDAPTHSDFGVDSAFDVYELDSLDQFPPRVRESLAYRVAAKVTRSIGRLNPDGTRSPTLLAFDEVHKIVDRYPAILRVINKGARSMKNFVSLSGTSSCFSFEPCWTISFSPARLTVSTADGLG